MTTDPAPAALSGRVSGRTSTRERMPPDPASGIRRFQHDYPMPMARWNHHPEYELHLTRKGTGKVLVGDHIERFAAGHVALFPEMEKLGDLLDRASRGIEFTGATARAAATGIEAIGRTAGLERLGHLFVLFAVLARSPERDRACLAGRLFAASARADFDVVVR